MVEERHATVRISVPYFGFGYNFLAQSALCRRLEELIQRLNRQLTG
jgi:hypothetical protein